MLQVAYSIGGGADLGGTRAMTDAREHLSDDFAGVSSNFGSALIDDPYPLFKQMRRESPVLPESFLARFGLPSQTDSGNSGRQVFTLFRYEDVTGALRDPATFSCQLLNEGQGFLSGENLWFAEDGQSHMRIRQLLQPQFSPGMAKKWMQRVIEPALRDDYVVPLAETGRADLLADFALPFPITVMYELLGFPCDAEQRAQFAIWGNRIIAGPQPDPEKAKITIPLALEAGRLMRGAVEQIIRDRRHSGAPGDDFLGAMLRASLDGDALDDGLIASLMMSLIPAASETTTRSFANLIVLLLERPALLERVRLDRSLVSAAIHESMRYEPTATFLSRLVEKDVEIAGTTLSAGSAALLGTGSASRDESVFADPDQLDIDRPRKPNFGFGYGVHMCLGMHVARLELEVALNVVLDLMPGLRFDPDRPQPRIIGMNLRGPEAIPVIWDH
jgi:cytochrome P450